MKKEESFAWIVVAVLIILFSIWFVYADTIRRSKALAHALQGDSYSIIKLPVSFKGRILPVEQVNLDRWNSAAISVDFSTISKWGKEAILTYSYSQSPTQIQLKAWRPDPYTSGLFQQASLSFDCFSDKNMPDPTKVDIVFKQGKFYLIYNYNLGPGIHAMIHNANSYAFLFACLLLFFLVASCVAIVYVSFGITREILKKNSLKRGEENVES